MFLCQICGTGTVQNKQYGAYACKKCGMAFKRYVENAKDKKPLKCEKDPERCKPGKVTEKRSCRKCRIERCYNFGMKENLLLKIKELQEKPIFEDERYPYLTVISKFFQETDAFINGRYRFDGNWHGPFSEEAFCHGCYYHSTYLNSYQAVFTSLLNTLPQFRSIPEAFVAGFADHVRPFYNLFCNNFQSYQIKHRNSVCVYEVLSMIKRSLPHITNEEQTMIARTLLEQREKSQTVLKPIFEEKVLGDDNCVKLFAYLLLINLMIKYLANCPAKVMFINESRNIWLEYIRYVYESNAWKVGADKVTACLEQVEKAGEETKETLRELNLRQYTEKNDKEDKKKETGD